MLIMILLDGINTSISSNELCSDTDTDRIWPRKDLEKMKELKSLINDQTVSLSDVVYQKNYKLKH